LGWFYGFAEVLSSDEDEIDEDGAEYLEALERKIKGSKAPFDISTDITVLNIMSILFS